MTEDTVPREEEIVSLSKEDFEKLSKKAEAADKSAEDKEKLVAEIKDLREKKRLSEEEAEELRSKVAATEEGQTVKNSEVTLDLVNQTVEQILSKREAEEVKLNKEEALRRFKETHKEFHEDNDEGGLKMSLLEKQLQDFNFSGLKTVNQFLDKFEKARRLVVQNNSVPEEGSPAPDEPEETSTPRISSDDNLTKTELRVIDQTFGGDKQKYIDTKNKRPDFVRELLRYVE